MALNLYTEMFMEEDPELPKWSNIRRLIRPARADEPIRPPLLDFLRAHETTYQKFKFAIYHLTIFQQIYGVNRDDLSRGTSAQQYWARAETHSIIFNLYSALDGLSYEINLAYNFGLKANEVSIKNKCLRYMIDKENDALSFYLKDLLDHQPWFEYFNKLRNQIAHRNLSILRFIMVVGEPTRINLPDDLSAPDEKTTFLRNIDVGQYCNETRDHVQKVIEDVYDLIEPKIRNTYGIRNLS